MTKAPSFLDCKTENKDEIRKVHPNRQIGISTSSVDNQLHQINHMFKEAGDSFYFEEKSAING